MSREWDAVRYDAQPLPHLRWGRRTLQRLDPAPEATVLDAGCGTGRDTELLLQRLSTGRVVALDGSRQMLARLQERLVGAGDRVQVVLADLEQPLPLPHPVDGVLSVAAFHWVLDHDALFANLAAVLRCGGRLATDCGGAGNIAQVSAAVDEVLGHRPSPWNFAGVEETRRRLERAGFTELDVQLRPDPARFADHAQLSEYLRTVVLGGQLADLPPDQHDGFVQAVAQRLDEPVVDYVRLEITATRG
jgi:trans-aconitate 2-methyltransferase